MAKSSGLSKWTAWPTSSITLNRALGIFSPICWAKRVNLGSSSPVTRSTRVLSSPGGARGMVSSPSRLILSSRRGLTGHWSHDGRAGCPAALAGGSRAIGTWVDGASTYKRQLAPGCVESPREPHRPVAAPLFRARGAGQGWHRSTRAGGTGQGGRGPSGGRAVRPSSSRSESRVRRCRLPHR